ncbi:class I SAM-dependent methyltransferase [Desulfovibrio inopinatus]|uniref:class I SAM-dependent methyltransferase n=1 Tax=Desulfovibrio inopinatus TaxID=102109 RepID=UPI0003F8D723|nr:class I SAM-dependent methyltransferase [Desulfovibrio inopinatus]
MHKTPSEEITKLLNDGLHRNEAYDLIPENSSKILDIGYGDGWLLMNLIYNKGCTECYGLELRPRPDVEKELDGAWNIDLVNEDLPEKYFNYFNWIILHDVLEHIYNPWKFLGIINKYLSDDGKIILVSPNAQYWEVPFALMHGNWPLGTHGYWNEDHVRWFTFKTFSELAMMAGFSVDNAYLQYPERFWEHAQDYEAFVKVQDKNISMFPPLNFPQHHMEDGFPFVSPTWDGADQTKVIFNKPAKDYFPFFMAIKIMLLCSKRGDPVMFDIVPGKLKTIRKNFYETLGTQELEKRRPKDIQIQVIRK